MRVGCGGAYGFGFGLRNDRPGKKGRQEKGAPLLLTTIGRAVFRPFAPSRPQEESRTCVSWTSPHHAERGRGVPSDEWSTLTSSIERRLRLASLRLGNRTAVNSGETRGTTIDRGCGPFSGNTTGMRKRNRVAGFEFQVSRFRFWFSRLGERRVTQQSLTSHFSFGVC